MSTVDAIQIDPAAIYKLQSAAPLVGVSKETLLRAVRNRELVAAKRGRVWFVQGAQLLRWLTSSDALVT